MAKKVEETGYRKAPIVALEPNPWNPNRMPGALFTKLVKNLEETMKKGKEIPPVVVRPHPTAKDRFQIIDGFHRYKAFKQLKFTDIGIFVMDVDDQTAKMLTMNLNYLRGDKDPERYTSILSDLMDGGMSLDNLSELLPEDEADISDLITTYGDSAAIRKLIEAQDEHVQKNSESGLSDENTFVELRFPVSVAQAKVVQREIDRISRTLDGNNLEGRALEFMAVQSGQTELPPELVKAKDKKRTEVVKPIDTLREKAKAKLQKMKETA